MGYPLGEYYGLYYPFPASLSCLAYILASAWFTVRWRRTQDSVAAVVAAFCMCRTVSFYLRLKSCNRLWPAFGYFLPGIITWNVGVAVILYATYLLACSRARSQPRYRIAMVIAILSAVMLDVKGETPTTSDYYWLRHHFEPEKRILRHASMLIFLLVSVFVALHSARVALQATSRERIRDLLDASKWRKPADLIHDPSLQYLAFPLIAILLLVRSGFLAGSTSTSSFQKEKWTHDGLPFYFFGVLPELFATLLFAIPGVISGPEDHDVLPTIVEGGHLLELYEAGPNDATTHCESRPSTPRERVD